MHLKFAAQIYREQVEGSRFFLHEHLDHAGSWGERCTSGILDMEGVSRVRADQCHYGQQIKSGPWLVNR